MTMYEINAHSPLYSSHSGLSLVNAALASNAAPPPVLIANRTFGWRKRKKSIQMDCLRWPMRVRAEEAN